MERNQTQIDVCWIYQQKGGVDAHDSIDLCPQFPVPSYDNDVNKVERNDTKDLNQRVDSNGCPVAKDGKSSLPVAWAKMLACTT